MTPPSLLTRYSWPCLSLVIGIAMGMTLGSDGPVQRKAVDDAGEVSDRVRRHGGIAGGSPVQVVRPRAGPEPALPRHVAKQLAEADFLATARTVWVPAELADRLRWKLGFFNDGFKLSSEAQHILQLGDAEKSQVEASIDRFVAGIRDIERRHALLLEKTATTVAVRVPAGLAPNGPQQKFEAELLPLLHEVKLRTLYVQLTANLKQMSAVISGKQMDLRAVLSGEQETSVELEMQSGYRSKSPSLPPEYQHLLPAVVGTGAARRWQ